MVARQDLIDALEAAWVRETSVDAEGWTPANPAYGQDAVTSLIIQDYLGGDLLRTLVDGFSHYYNRLPDGEILDLTFRQFPAGATSSPPVVRDRAYVVSFPATVVRYDRLRAVVERVLGAA